jgi:N,N'-diacetyllegionaminate synthase
MNKEIRIGKRVIGKEQPLFIIAECGVTCNYNMAIAKELIDVVKESQADAIKFIFWFPEEIMSDRTTLYSYETVSGRRTENMYDMLSKLRFSLDEWKELKAHADQRNVLLFATVNSPGGIAYAEELGLEAYKLSSWDYNYFPLFKRVASYGKPILLDAGPVRTIDVAKVVHTMREEKNDQIVLIHCYHTSNFREMNMRAIPYMESAFNTLSGYSSPDVNDEMDIVAASLGAVVVEKRLTMSRNLPGHHHILSKEPKEFAEYVGMIRNVQSALGTFDLVPSASDLEERRKWFRHIVAARDISKGTRLTEDMLEGKRPEIGVSPEYMDFFVGRVVNRDLKKDEAVTWDCV